MSVNFAMAVLKLEEARNTVFDLRRERLELRATVERVQAENARLREALEKVFAVGDGYESNTKDRPAGTTGDGHARCREIARAALDPQ